MPQILTTSLIVEAQLAQDFWEDPRRRIKSKLPRLSPTEAKEICDEVAEIMLSVKKFEREIWYDRLQGYVRCSAIRGHSGHTVSGHTVSDTKAPDARVSDITVSDTRISTTRVSDTKISGTRVLVWSGAGRALISLQQGEASITLITAEDEKQGARAEWTGNNDGPMGIQAIEATKDQALRILKSAVDMFPLLSEDKTVTISGL